MCVNTGAISVCQRNKRFIENIVVAHENLQRFAILNLMNFTSLHRPANIQNLNDLKPQGKGPYTTDIKSF